MFGLPSPWLMLAVVLAAIGLAGVSYSRGHSNGIHAQQVITQREDAQRALKTAENLQRARDTQDKLQAAADAARKQNADLLAAMDDRLHRANERLRQRPARPVSDNGAVSVAGPGANGGCTGAGLYSDDGLFLAGKADVWQRIRLQRDACYAAYATAQEAIIRLSPSPASETTK